MQVKTGKSPVGLSNLFFAWNLNKLFCKLTFSLPADTEPVQIQQRLIDLPKIEKCVCFLAYCGSCVVKFLIMIGLFVRPQTQRERNVVLFSAAFCGEERNLCNGTKNSCVTD